MNKKYIKIFEKYGLRFSNCVGSKSMYKKENPNSLIIFNARIYLKSYYKKEKDKAIRDFFEGQEAEIWYGDLNLNMDIYNLYRIHLDIGEAIIVTNEIGNKMIEIGDSLDRHWIATIGSGKNTKGISLKDWKNKK